MNKQQANKAMAKVVKLAEQRRLLDIEIADAVHVCRQEDFEGYPLWSWEAIATALGVSKQAAHQRYAK